MEFNQINLTTRDHVDRRVLYGLLGAVAALLVIFTVLNAVNGIQAYREQRDYRNKIEDLREQAGALREDKSEGGGFTTDAAEDMQERSRHANYLIALDVFPWIAILDALEEAVPARIVLERFAPVPDLKSIRISGYTPSVEPLTQFQDALGKAAVFQSIVLENMDLGTGDAPRTSAKPTGAIRFEMMCHLDLRALLPEETYGGLWMTLASQGGGKARKR